MDTFVDKLGCIGTWFDQNKYLLAIKNAFQNFMPATIAVQDPWTCPPLLMGFIGTGGFIMGAYSWLIVFAVAVVIYIPFFLAYEKQQKKSL